MAWKDPIVEEVRRVRDEHAKSLGYDLHRIFEDVKRRERESGRTYIRLNPRRCQAGDIGSLDSPKGVGPEEARDPAEPGAAADDASTRG